MCERESEKEKETKYREVEKVKERKREREIKASMKFHNSILIQKTTQLRFSLCIYVYRHRLYSASTKLCDKVLVTTRGRGVSNLRQNKPSYELWLL